MGDFFKQKYKAIALLTSLLVVVTGASGGLAWWASDGGMFSSAASIQEEVSEVSEVESLPEIEEVEEGIEYNIPSNMKGVFLTAGEDYYTQESDDGQTIRSQIDTAFDEAETLSLNTIIIDTRYEDQVIYETADSNTIPLDFDVMEYIVDTAKQRDFYTYALFDMAPYRSVSTITGSLAIGGGTVSKDVVDVNLSEFVETYSLDAVMLDGYTFENSKEGYSAYSVLGGGIGYNNYLKQTPESLVRTASEIVKQTSPTTQVGILADAVWENEEQNENGSKTSASYTSLSNGNADTKAFVEDGLVQFVMVKALSATDDSQEPFEEIVSWWADVARTSNIPLYVMQASSKLTDEAGSWATNDQLLKQAETLDSISGVRGNAYDSLSSLTSESSGISSVLDFYEEAAAPVVVLQELEMTKPTQTTYTTNEQKVTFTGASDPEQPVTINGETIKTDQSGYFTVTYDLSAGANSFSIVHKEKTVDYNITRSVEVLKEISPTGNITADGGMEIAITAWAYQGSTVIASVGSSSVTLKVNEDVIDEDFRDSSYKKYTGIFVAPAGGSSDQTLGSITVTATLNGESKSLTGGSVTVNKKAKIEDGVPVVVVAEQAMTYPATTLDNIPQADVYPLPKGAMDYAVGEEIVYKDVSYTVLASGLRVKSSDIASSSDYASQNTISGMSVDVKDGFTYITLKTAQKVSYNFGYANNAVTIRMNNTTAVPEGMDLTQNPIFSGASWDGSTLSLQLIKSGGFMGYKGYYDESGNLVFRFNNPPTSISGARIVIDPGHGGKDTGALGFLAEYPEKVINSAIADALANELQSRGATVLLLDTSSGMDLATRTAKAEAFNADILISVHNNSASSSSAQGTEIYYFNPFSKALATSAASNVSGQLGTNNRGAKQSYYTITLSSQYASVLVEGGFLSNKDEYEKLIKEKYQVRIATGIADSIEEAIYSASTGISGGGSESSGGSIVSEGNSSTASSTESSSSSSQSSASGTTGAVTGVSLNRSSLSLSVGKKASLNAQISPSSATNTKLIWSSSDKTVATVDSDGLVSALKAGKATITVQTDDGGYKATCTITVSQPSSGSTSSSDVSVESLKMSDSEFTLPTGETYTLKAIVSPSNATNPSVNWKSSNTAVVSVSQDGTISGVSAGTATITATAEDGGSTATTKVTVTASGSSSSSSGTALKGVEQIYLSAPTSTIYIKSSITLSVEDEDGNIIPNDQLKWSSTNKSVATVSNGVVTAKSVAGTATISADSPNDEGVFDTIVITVTKDKVSVTSVSLNHQEIQLTVGASSSILKATVLPSNATNQALVWRTSNSSVATVDSNGKVTGVGNGTTTVICRTADGSFQATCKVSVGSSATLDYIEMEIDSFEMQVGSTDSLSVTFEPAVADQSLTWSSSNSNIVSVDSSGNLKALKKGTVTITATSVLDPSCTTTCKITVYE